MIINRMKYFNQLSLLLLLLLGIAAVNPVSAVAQLDSTSVRELLDDRDRQIKDLMGPKGTEYTQEQRDKLKDIINGIIDYCAMAQQALQDTYETLSDDQKNEFVDLFSTIIRDQSLNKLDIYRAQVKYEQIIVKDSSATVETMASLEKVRTPVSYQMEFRDKKDQWVVTDLIIDDVSTAESYQRQFQRIIKKKGYDSLLETLRKRAAR